MNKQQVVSYEGLKVEGNQVEKTKKIFRFTRVPTMVSHSAVERMNTTRGQKREKERIVEGK